MLNLYNTILLLCIICWLKPSLSSDIDMQHQEWTSSIYYDETDNFIASTDHTGQYGDITLFLGRTTKDCNMWDMTLTLEGKSIAPKAFESGLFKGELRIDNKSIHSIEYQISFEEDEAYFFIELMEPYNKNTILGEIQQGERLRLKLTINDRNYVLGFPLQGAQEAIERAKLLCVRHKPDEDYFGGRAKNAPDIQVML